MELLLLLLLFLLWKRRSFYKSGYPQISGHKFLGTFLNKGNYGEYLTYRHLCKLDGYNKIVTNVYLPKRNGTTTEIDLVMVSTKGIFVLESKNFSGWIFGNENYKMWTQVLKGGIKNKFFNPIWQNNGHLKALDQYFEGRYSGKFYSYIVFSERCKLKDITVNSENVTVLKRNELLPVLASHYATLSQVLTLQEVDAIYDALRKHSNVAKEIKQKHRETVSRSYK